MKEDSDQWTGTVSPSHCPSPRTPFTSFTSFTIIKRPPTIHAEGRFVLPKRYGLFADIHLVEQVASATELVDDEEHIAGIHIDTALQSRVEHDIATQSLPVAVEGQTDEFTVSVHDGAAGVATGDVVVGKEADV